MIFGETPPRAGQEERLLAALRVSGRKAPDVDGGQATEPAGVLCPVV